MQFARYFANDAGVSASLVVCSNDGGEDTVSGNWSTYLAGSSYLGLREFPASRLVITALVIGPETVSLVQLRRLAIFRPMPLKPGDSPRYIRLTSPPLYSQFLCKNGGHPRREDVRFAGRSLHGIRSIRLAFQVYRWKAHTMLSSPKNSSVREIKFALSRKNIGTQQKIISTVRCLYLIIFRFLSAISPPSDSTA